jgi:hypothetical protein
MKQISCVLLVCSLLASGWASAGGDWSMGNSGNTLALEFVKDAREAVEAVEKDGIDYPELQSAHLEQVLENAKIIASDTPLYRSIDGVNQRADAINFHDPDTIILDEGLWHEITNPNVRKALALHELLGLAGFEETGLYPISGKYLASLGVHCAENLCVPEEVEGDPLLAGSASGAFQNTPSVQGAQDPSWGFNPYNIAMGGYDPGEIWSAASYLVGSVDTSADRVDLSQEGETDWVQWDIVTHRKATDTPVLPDYGYLQPHQKVTGYSTDARPLSWSDGAPVESASNDRTGFFVTDYLNGFSFTAPSDQDVRVLTVHVSEFFASGILVAELMDGSGQVYQDLVPASNIDAGYDRNYTITYSSKNPTRLRVNWVVNSVSTSSKGNNVNLSGVALALLGNTVAESKIAGTWNDSDAPADLTQEGTSDWVHFGTGVFVRKATGGSQISDFSTPSFTRDEARLLSWSDGATQQSAVNNTDIRLADMNNGFVFTIPADNQRHHLVVHVGGEYLTSAIFTAQLDDGSGYVYTDEIGPTASAFDRNYALDFNASKPSTLTINWKITSSLGGIRLSGMALK